MLIDQLQEEVAALRAELRQLTAAAAEERRLTQAEIARLTQLVADRDDQIRQLLAAGG